MSDFIVDERGVFFCAPEKDPQWICSPLFILAQTRSENGDNWGRLLQFPDNDGVQKQWAMPMQMLAGDGFELRERLLELGLQIAPSSDARKKLSMYILSSKVESRARCVTQVGWHNEVFILPEGAIGTTAGERVILQSTLEFENKMRTAGTLDEWKFHIARPCVDNPRLVLALSVAFAAPLLKLLGEEGGGFHFNGPSSVGKTTVLAAAASVYGPGDGAGYMNTWRATSNGLEATAAMHNDCLLVLDELAQVSAKEAGESAYMLANGLGKSRAGRSGGARKRAGWRILFLSAGEIGLAHHIAQAGQQIRAGQEVRMLDIAADAGKGLGIYDTIHTFPCSAALSDHLIDASKKFYGTAIREYLTALVANIDEAKTIALSVMEKFAKDNVPKSASGEIVRGAARFGLAAAAGTLAAKFNIVPWDEKEAVATAESLLATWVDSRGGYESKEGDRALAQVRGFLQEHGTARFQNWNASEDRSPRRAGFRWEDDGQVKEWMVFPATYNAEVCKGFEPKFVTKVLKERGHLRAGTDGKSQSSEKLPGMGKSRVYCIRRSIMDE